MVNLIIDGIKTEAAEGSTILECARGLGIKIPTLCLLKDINEIGACRMCVVEVEGNERLMASCNTPVAEGMVVHTDTEKVRRARRTNLELILSEHDADCPECPRNGNCRLQDLAAEMNILGIPYDKKIMKDRWDASDILIRRDSKCIKCMRCVDVCSKVQGLKVWDLTGSGNSARITAAAKSLSTVCSLCGQCITHCPVGALSARDDTERVFEAIRDPKKVVVAQIAPAVRTAWAEGLGIPKEKATEKRMASAMRALGADFVFDTNFAADLTIMEEAAEFAERYTHNDKYKMPMFTSCCPGWVRFVKIRYPELLGNLSTAKSPQQMFGAVAKSYFAEKSGIDPERIFCVSVMPCTAKKYECDVNEINSSGYKDVDAVITTREFAKMLQMKCVNVNDIPETEFDSPMGESSGAGVIFGATGGVMEAAVRTAYHMITGKNPDPDAFRVIRGTAGWRELTADIGGNTVRIAVASGLGEADRLIKAVKSRNAYYDFVEIMACPGGCAGGGGQPVTDGREPALERGEYLYDLDRKRNVRFSHENGSIKKLYDEYLGSPMSEKAHRILHTSQDEWSL